MRATPTGRGSTLIACAALACSACWRPDEAADDKRYEKREGGPIIKLEKSGCFGPCAVYSVELDEKGNVTFEGERFVGAFGKQSGNVDPDVVRELAAFLTGDGFFSVDVVPTEKCDKGAKTDNATYTVTLTSAGKHRAISEYLGNNCKLERIDDWAARIDKAAEVAKWLQCPGGCREKPGADPGSDAL